MAQYGARSHRHSQDFSKGGVTLCQSEGTRLFGRFQADMF